MDVENTIVETAKRNWFKRLFDTDDKTVSATTVFMFILTFIGCMLLIVPAVALIIEIWYNHTITTDLNGMAAYITAVTALFTAAGLTKAWSNWANYKYNGKKKKPIDTGSSDSDSEMMY